MNGCRIVWLALAALALAGCDDGGGGGGAGGGGGGGTADMGPPPGVPFEGAIAPLPAGTMIEPADHFPLVEGGVWRYRREEADPLNPGPVEQGGEASVQSVTPTDDGKLEVVRRIVSIIDLPQDGMPRKVRQVMDETFVVTPADRLVGPRVEYKALRIEEREVESQAFVRLLERTYLPPYVFIEDAWKVGLIQTNIQVSDIRLIQALTLPGDEEPRETEGLVEVRVDVEPVGEGRGSIIPMEGRYRENIRQIKVFDDFSAMLQRSYYVEPGVGLVKWVFAASNNVPFTLTETNLEAPAVEEGQ
ncbi:MAG: hypothetical protein R3F60_01540 [bacterium]